MVEYQHLPFSPSIKSSLFSYGLSRVGWCRSINKTKFVYFEVTFHHWIAPPPPTPTNNPYRRGSYRLRRHFSFPSFLALGDSKKVIQFKALFFLYIMCDKQWPYSVSSSSSASLGDSEEELQHMPLAPLAWASRKRLSKQLSMCETPRDIAWEKRRRQILRQERRRNGIHDSEDLTDGDLNELKGSIELGFGFNEEDGQTLCNTLPALDLYFAINRQLSPSPVSTPHSRGSSLGGRSSSFGSDPDSWKICRAGDDPEHVKTKLRHWAQAVACSVIQSS